MTLGRAASRDLWALEQDVTFLNHGSFGACPRVVLDAQAEYRAQMEAEPVRFFVRELEPLVAEVRARMASFLGARGEDIGFVTNATAGANAVVRSLRFAAGDQLLVTNHGYNAVRNIAAHVAARDGAELVVVDLPFPLSDPAEVTEAITRAVGPRTKLAIIDHITSPTGLVLPILDIVRALRSQGVDTLVDGAHGPGMLPLDLEELGAAYYTGNFHKWCCAPKTAAFLWVRRDRQANLHPAVMSHGYNSGRPRARFLEEFDWQGTHDPSPYLCVPAALDFLDGLVDGGHEALMTRNRALAIEGRRVLLGALELEAPAPESMVGSLAALPLPPSSTSAPPSSALYVDPLQLALYDEHRVEVPIPPWPAPPARLVRVSAQAYNELADYERLATALGRELHKQLHDTTNVVGISCVMQLTDGSEMMNERVGTTDGDVRAEVRERYTAAAKATGGCCGGADPRKTSESIGYDGDQLDSVPEEANLGLGCGNPTALAGLKAGEVVVDLGAGAGLDSLIAAPKVGPTGHIIGVDMTREMLGRARRNAVKMGVEDFVEFREGIIEALPVATETADVIISNCVINLSPDKPAVFREAFRVLKPGGRFAVSDILLSEPLPVELAELAAVYAACVGGALVADEYLGGLRDAGFENIEFTRAPAAALLAASSADPIVVPAVEAVGAERLDAVAKTIFSYKITAWKPTDSSAKS